MSVKNKTMELLNYINTPMNKENMELLYSANNIRYEKCELYNDCVQSLIALIFDTYMGDEITSLSERRNHFRWCWNKNLENFNKEGIDFSSPKLHDYFLDFMMDVFYPQTNKNENPTAQAKMSKLWSYVFDLKLVKTKSDMDMLIEIYTLFEQSLKTEK